MSRTKWYLRASQRLSFPSCRIRVTVEVCIKLTLGSRHRSPSHQLVACHRYAMCLACILLAAMKAKGSNPRWESLCAPHAVVSGLALGLALPYTVTPTAAAITAFLRTCDFLFSKFLTYNVICQLSLRWGWGWTSTRPGVPS